MSVRLEAGAAWIAFDEPERGNPLRLESVQHLLHDVRTAKEADARVVVLAPTGFAFSVGGDLADFARAERPADHVLELAELLNVVVRELWQLDAVVVSVVQGVAAGAGFPLAAAADIVLAAESARFTLAYTKVGLTPDGGASLLTSSLGLHRALSLALLNDVVSAEEACALGLVAAVHPDDALRAAAERVVRDLLSGSRAAQVGAKRLLRDQAVRDPEAALRREAVSMFDVAGSQDGREGVQAFLEKRPPQFA
jgi:2-(1,2-epoxy-1,2-dihydrophenyl)acetyl-CoA isomerase